MFLCKKKVEMLYPYIVMIHNRNFLETLTLWFMLVLWYQVFGMDKKYWFIPAYSEEDIRKMPALQGLEYPSKPDFDSQ
jgi:hypothetical protein